MTDPTHEPAQRWHTLPSTVQEIVIKRLRKDADRALLAGRTHADAAKTKRSDSAHKKEAARAQQKLTEATALMAALRELTGQAGASAVAEESRIIQV